MQDETLNEMDTKKLDETLEVVEIQDDLDIDISDIEEDNDVAFFNEELEEDEENENESEANDEDQATKQTSSKRKTYSKKRQLEYFKKRRKIHYVKSVISRARIISRIAAISLVIGILVGLTQSPSWYLPKKVFSSYPSKHLKFEGNYITPNIKILNAIRKIKLPQKPLYLIDTEIFEHELLKIPSVKRVYVKRFGFPASLKIVLEERKPILSIAPNPNAPVVAVFTEDGTAIGRDFLPLSKKIPTFRILTYEDYFGWTKKQVEYLAYLAKTAEIYSKEEVQYIDIRNPDDARIRIKSVTIRLGQLNKTVFKRLKKISAILPQTVNLNSKIEYVDLRWKDSAYIKLQK